MKLVEDAADIGKSEMRTKFWLEILKGKQHSEVLGIDERIIVK
jgi:hypothetical protein